MGWCTNDAPTILKTLTVVYTFSVQLLYVQSLSDTLLVNMKKVVNGHFLTYPDNI